MARARALATIDVSEGGCRARCTVRERPGNGFQAAERGRKGPVAEGTSRLSSCLPEDASNTKLPPRGLGALQVLNTDLAETSPGRSPASTPVPSPQGGPILNCACVPKGEWVPAGFRGTKKHGPEAPLGSTPPS